MGKIDSWKKENDYNESLERLKNDLDKFHISDNEWAHLHDCVLEVTWNTSKKSCTFKELVDIYIALPWGLKGLAMQYGMNDTEFSEQFIEHYKENYDL